MKPIPIYIGYDKTETVAYHVLAHSIIRRSSVPVSIIPLNRDNLASCYTRPRGEFDSTDFSNSRFLVPYLQEYDGWAIFMDCDMLCLWDIAELWEQRNHRYDVMVKKHDHVPTEETKFLGAKQTKYNMKNWSSLMLMNTPRCAISKHEVNTLPGLWLHQFEWVSMKENIGEIEGPWNHLVNVDPHHADPALIHFTKGGPWHQVHSAYDQKWYAELEHMEQGDNPIDWRSGDASAAINS